MRSYGCLERLVEIIKRVDFTVVLRTVALNCLATVLKENEGNQDHMLKINAIPSLVSLLQSESQDILAGTLLVLSALALNNSKTTISIL